MYQYKGNGLMQYYKGLLEEDKNKIKEMPTLQLAQDIENFFGTKLHFSMNRRIGSKDMWSYLSPQATWLNMLNPSFYHLVSSREWEKYIGEIEEDEEFLFYDRVAELASKVFEAMSDTQKFEVLETLFKKSDFKPYLNVNSYFCVCLKAVQQTSPKVAEKFLCKIYDEFIEGKDWCENLSKKEMEEVDASFKYMMYNALNPKETAHFFHSMLERNQDNLHKQELILKKFKNILSLMYNIDDESRYWTPRVGYKNSDVAPENVRRLDKKKYNRTLFEFFKFDNSKQLLAKINPIFAETFASPYAISKRDGREIASFFKNVAMQLIDVGPTQYRGDSCIKCSDYTVDLFKFLMDENRTDALDAICSIKDIEEIFPLFSTKGFIFQDYKEISEEIKKQQKIEEPNIVEKNEMINETKVTQNPKESKEEHKR